MDAIKEVYSKCIIVALDAQDSFVSLQNTLLYHLLAGTLEKRSDGLQPKKYQSSSPLMKLKTFILKSRQTTCTCRIKPNKLGK